MWPNRYGRLYGLALLAGACAVVSDIGGPVDPPPWAGKTYGKRGGPNGTGGFVRGFLETSFSSAKSQS